MKRGEKMREKLIRGVSVRGVNDGIRVELLFKGQGWVIGPSYLLKPHCFVLILIFLI